MNRSWTKFWISTALTWVNACGPIVGNRIIKDDQGRDVAPPIENAAALPVPTDLSCAKGTTLTYENFGEPFLLSYCTSCHSAALPEESRGGAPIDVNLDTAEGVAVWRRSIIQVTTPDNGTMPPFPGMVSRRERILLGEWLNCGAPGNTDSLQSDDPD